MQHTAITGEQAAALARLIYKRLGDGDFGKHPPKTLRSWSGLVLNVDDREVLTVSTPLNEEPYLRYEIQPDGRMAAQ